MNIDVAKSADALLRQYAEEVSRVSSPQSPRFSGPEGVITVKRCLATKRCDGSPRWHADGQWKCSRCQRDWLLERVYLERLSLGVGRSSSPLDDPARARFSSILDSVECETPTAFACWWIHVLDASLVGEVVQGDVRREIGMPVEFIPQRMRDLAAAGCLRSPGGSITIERVCRWIVEARRAVMRRVIVEGL